MRDQNVFMARLAEQAERYEDMAGPLVLDAWHGCEVEFMRRVAVVPQELSRGAHTPLEP